jgi:hypothetical protein
VGMILWMGLDKKPSLQDYWRQNPLYSNKLSSVMSRNMFELILSSVYFCDNESRDPNDKLYKITKLLHLVNDISKSNYSR